MLSHWLGMHKKNIAVLASQSHSRRSLYRHFVATAKDFSNVRRLISDLSGTFQVKSNFNTPVMQWTGRVRKQEGGMPTQDFARSLPFWTSLRLGSAPVRLACTQRGPRRGLVLVCSGRRRIPLAFISIAPWRYKSNKPPAKGHRGPSTASKINGKPKGSHVK